MECYIASMFNPDHLTFGSKMDQYVPTRVGGDLPRMVLGTVHGPLRAPFGISTPYAGGGDKAETENRRTFDLEIDEEMAAVLRAVDEKVLATAVERSEEWFGKKLDEAVLRSMHNTLVQQKDGKKPMVRTKFSVKRDKETKVYIATSEGEARSGCKTDIEKHVEVCVDVVLSSVMLSRSSFNVSLTCEQVLVAAAAKTARGVDVFGDIVLRD